ncbi:hypothetical protein SELMODRAFT_402882 [Selaginella moellendorffii]|uniref:cytokinin riboside 5'-monophosphate phosphoribohydrolase n=1 Tax=Selaginella moellendorffii TaxID=88036 RepID=D8QNC3_SELML|nr:hypothetical protein SELMODRAFT_402882 [Selaginella moellendorffii]
MELICLVWLSQEDELALSERVNSLFWWYFIFPSSCLLTPDLLYEFVVCDPFRGEEENRSGLRRRQRRTDGTYSGSGLRRWLSRYWSNPKSVDASRQISGKTVGEVKVVSDMHQRKAEMARQVEAFIALPGGYGTLEELLEMITWSQLGIHDKPVRDLALSHMESRPAKRCNLLLALFDKGTEKGFIKPSSRQIVISASTAGELLDRLEAYVPNHVSVAPKETWEIEQLGYSAASAPPSHTL